MKKWLFKEAWQPTIVTKVVDLMGLNLIFLMSCLPIVTIGTSLMALYEMAFKMADSEKDYDLVKDYFKSFTRNFLRGTTALGFILVVALLLVLAVYGVNGWVPEAGANLLITLPFLVSVTVVGLMVMYVFPLLAYFENTLLRTFKNAVIISFHQMAKSIVLFLIALIILVIIPLVSTQFWFLWLLLGFSATAYLQSMILIRIFNHYTASRSRG